MNDYHLLSTTSMTSAGAAALESVLSGKQMQRVLNDAVWAARVLLHVDASIIFLAESETFRAIAWHGWEAGGTQISAENVAATAFRAGRRSISWSRREKCSDATLTALMEQLGLQGGMLVPVLVGGDLRAIWLVATQSERSFTQADELALYTLAENVGLTTESALLSAENLRYRREADALYEIGKEITQLMDLDRVLDVIAEKARDLLGAEISYIALADDEADQAVHVRVTKGTWTDMLKRMVLKYGEGVGGYVAATRTPLLLDNYPEDPRPKPPGVANLVATEDIISVLCVPMSTRTRTIGVLYVATRRPGSFRRSQLDLLTALGDHAAVAIENARLYEEERITSEKLRALNAAVESERARLRATMTTNEQLLALVLGNRGLQAIADTVAELIGCPIAVEDGRSNLLCWSVKGTRDASRMEELQPGALSSAELWRTPGLRPQLDALRTTMRLVRLPALPRQAVPHPRAMTVIAAGARILGYLSALETAEILTEQQCSALEQAAIVFALEFLKQEAAQAVEQRLAGDLLDDLLFRRGEADASLYQRSSRLNVDLHRPHRIVVLDIDAFADAIHAHNWTDVQALNIKRRFSSLVGDVTARSAPGTLIGTRSDSVLMLLADTGLADVKRLLNEIQEALRIPLPDLTVSAGVGRAFVGAHNFARSYMDALMALRTVRSMGGLSETVAFEELGVLPLLLQTEDQDALLAFMQRHLKSLLDYDTEHQTQLVSTLQAYLAQNGNLQRTATSCFIHLNTLKYRLRRIQEISGLELERGDTRFNLQLSLAIYSALNVLRDFGKQQTI